MKVNYRKNRKFIKIGGGDKCVSMRAPGIPLTSKESKTGKKNERERGKNEEKKLIPGGGSQTHELTQTCPRHTGYSLRGKWSA